MERLPPPINTLPVEILGEIFSVTQTISKQHPQYTITHSRGPFLPFLVLCQLSGVCSLWREIVIGTPQLWTHIHYRRRQSYSVNPGSMGLLEIVDAQFAKVQRIIQLYLERSGDMPLEIVLESTGGPASSELQLLKKLVVSHFWRVRVLKLHFGATRENLIFLPLPAMGQLEHFSFHSASELDDLSYSPNPIKVFASPPRSHLRYLRVRTHVNISFDSLPTEHVVDVSLTIPLPRRRRDVVAFLGRCSSLHKLRIWPEAPQLPLALVAAAGAHSPGAGDQTFVTLPLTHLDISDLTLPVLLVDLHMPLLQTLTITGRIGMSLHAGHLQFSSWDHLSKLTLTTTSLPVEVLHDLLSANPTIKTIEVHSCSAYTRIPIVLLGLGNINFKRHDLMISRLADEVTSRVVVAPYLEYLEFRLQGPQEQPSPAFGHFVFKLLESRPKLSIGSHIEGFEASIIGFEEIERRFGSRFVELKDYSNP